MYKANATLLWLNLMVAIIPAKQGFRVRLLQMTEQRDDKRHAATSDDSVASERLVHPWEPKGLISLRSQHTQIIHKCLPDYSGEIGSGDEQAITDFELALCNGPL